MGVQLHPTSYSMSPSLYMYNLLGGAAKNFIQVVHPNKINYMNKMSKKNLGSIIQAITGHGLFSHHIRKWKKYVDQTCQCCLEEDVETARHLWS